MIIKKNFKQAQERVGVTELPQHQKTTLWIIRKSQVKVWPLASMLKISAAAWLYKEWRNIFTCLLVPHTYL